jgi:hypothetical protein
MAISFIKNLKAKADKIRKTIEEGSNTLRELREEVEGTVDKLKVDSEEKLMDTVTEIQESTGVFEEAGYELIGLRIEMGFNPKVVPRIRRVKDISDQEFRRLMDKHADREVVNALLNAIRKAEQLEDKVSIKNLELCNFEIEVGVVPAIHATWAKPEPKLAPVAAAPPTREVTKEESEPAESDSRFGKSSFVTSSFSSSYTPPKYEPYQSTTPSYANPSSSSSEPGEEAEVGAEEPTDVETVAVPAAESKSGLDRWVTFPKID